jgi:hypothetical protein
MTISHIIAHSDNIYYSYLQPQHMSSKLSIHHNYSYSSTHQVDTSTIPGEEVGLRLAHAAGFLPSSYMTDGAGDLRDIDELSQVGQ